MIEHERGLQRLARARLDKREVAPAHAEIKRQSRRAERAQVRGEPRAAERNVAAVQHAARARDAAHPRDGRQFLGKSRSARLDARDRRKRASARSAPLCEQLRLARAVPRGHVRLDEHHSPADAALGRVPRKIEPPRELRRLREPRRRQRRGVPRMQMRVCPAARVCRGRERLHSRTLPATLPECPTPRTAWPSTTPSPSAALACAFRRSASAR